MYNIHDKVKKEIWLGAKRLETTCKDKQFDWTSTDEEDTNIEQQLLKIKLTREGFKIIKEMWELTKVMFILNDPETNTRVKQEFKNIFNELYNHIKVPWRWRLNSKNIFNILKTRIKNKNIDILSVTINNRRIYLIPQVINKLGLWNKP